ncbi:MAG TPA: hypothetical protein DEP20_02390 [Fusobacteria bacterium]|nr:hypothetical protein [Fusobacteriota bacterium]|tara:strand:+ start:15050 stop:16108 length:1059 start_codon:yes stop_codon:yes gene_type:complete
MIKRESILRNYGAKGDAVDQLLEYTRNHFHHNKFTQLEDEDFAKVWKNYRSDFSFLREKIVEFNFPIEEGMSQNDDYIAAQETGRVAEKYRRSKGIDLKSIEISSVLTPGGNMPLIILRDRSEFERVIQCFSYNNEPGKVPKSMGASTYAGYSNWDRILSYKEEWTMATGGNEFEWAKEFEKLKNNKRLFKDSFIVLSNGPYSAVPSGDVGMGESEWKRVSLDIRKFHETTHYFTKRILGSMNNNIIDEIFCDYVGVAKATGKYNVDWALRFLGLENYPKYRKGGRLENYASVDSEDAKKILKVLVFDAVNNMAKLPSMDEYKLIYELSRFSLPEIAGEFDRVLYHFEEVVK